MKNMTIEINRFFAVRQNGRDANPIAVLNIKVSERAVHLPCPIPFRNIQAQHRARLVRDDAFDFNVTKSARGEDATCDFQNFR